ncbi:MAG TPA: rRNA maturation RNase YbeY [Verrucomicrobiae bacterium]|nr:rRNA maturation RNase YbeY [Verrucomicrobiae bacterium]
MQIHYRNEVRGSGIDPRAIKSVARKLLAAVDHADAAISLTLVDDAAIREINREHRGMDQPTDVLSFSLEPEPFVPEVLLGDIVISLETAQRQAAEYDAPLQREVERLMIHGLLHVLGHDHMEPQERHAMEAEERRLAAVIGMPWPYDEN